MQFPAICITRWVHERESARDADDDDREEKKVGNSNSKEA